MPQNVTITPTTEIEIRRTPDYRAYYSNQSRMRMTNAEIQVFFGQLVDNPPGKNTFINEECLSVIMSPIQAKLLAHGLASALLAFEEQFGEVKLATGTLQAAEEVREALLKAARTALK